MFKKLSSRLTLYKKMLADLKEQEKKQLQYDSLVGESLNYSIIKDLMTVAQSGLEIKVRLKDGTTLEITRDAATPSQKYGPDSLF